MVTMWACLGPELFGIPFVLLILIIIWAIASVADEREKRLKPWHNLSTDMSPESVRALLGPPDQVSRSGNQEVWTYGIGPTRGSVAFEQGKVVGYRKPPGA